MTPVLHFQPNPDSLWQVKGILVRIVQILKRPHAYQITKVKMTNPLPSYTSECNFNVKFCNRPSALRKVVAQSK